MEINYDLTLKHPARILIFGPSRSGKTTLVEKILLNMDQIFGFLFDCILYVSGQGFPNINDVNGIKINKYTEFNNDLLDNLNPMKRNLLIFDDNLNLTNDRLISDLFSKYSHHKNITVIYLMQNLFPRTKYTRDVSINASYIILMSNPRETIQIKKLSQNVHGNHFIYECFQDATKDNPYSYLLLDFVQDTPEFLRIRTSLFYNEKINIYVKKEKT